VYNEAMNIKGIDLKGNKPCIHKKIFFGMIGGRCIKCGGYLTSLGMNKKAINKVKPKKEEVLKIGKKLFTREMLEYTHMEVLQEMVNYQIDQIILDLRPNLPWTQGKGEDVFGNNSDF
jgi:hypothetical protein